MYSPEQFLEWSKAVNLLTASIGSDQLQQSGSSLLFAFAKVKKHSRNLQRSAQQLYHGHLPYLREPLLHQPGIPLKDPRAAAAL